ncbi:uncharacterized protein CDV56_104078 [Aspergillus thermomutatus]|uniref:NCT transcriptional regulatory complex subunit B n=1 Tax=Aspergillus thermomutatus TaxID=41047 RepID=A0A397G2G9_ASPTH|nr:uncharacterized protein CDV56_104078 [Aspergillus thermomutatus]RHZ45232.1 hypothetical protein CDV56_104078 [Aspergillus thermomutatus]
MGIHNTINGANFWKRESVFISSHCGQKLLKLSHSERTGYGKEEAGSHELVSTASRRTRRENFLYARDAAATSPLPIEPTAVVGRVVLAGDATVQKIITEILPPSSGQTFSKDARDLLMECCVEFITLISSEANDISEKEAKKTIACEHVERALRDLGFGDYIPDVLAVAEEHKEQLKSREKKQSKMEQSGLTEEELLRQQQELFRSATEKYNAAPE